jgi:hypothetical protein
MNCLKTFVLIALLAGANFCYAQKDAVYIYESDMTELCGRYVRLEGIWIDNGVRKADISILESQNSKPITGGYKWNDTLQIGEKKKCSFYIHEVYKKGILTKGVVKISAENPEVTLSVMQGIFSLKEGDNIYEDNTYVISKINKNSSGIPTVEIKIKREDLDTTLYYKSGDKIWYEGFPFELSNISADTKTCEFTKMNNYSYTSGDSIKGKDINKPIYEK